MCAYDCAQLSYTIQHRTVLIIFPVYIEKNADGTGWLEFSYIVVMVHST